MADKWEIYQAKKENNAQLPLGMLTLMRQLLQSIIQTSNLEVAIQVSPLPDANLNRYLLLGQRYMDQLNNELATRWTARFEKSPAGGIPSVKYFNAITELRFFIE